jgi:hypothetical protein
MSSRMYAYLRVLIGVLFVFVIINSFILNPNSRTVRNDVIQGILLGAGMAFATLPIIARFYVTKVNGWTTVFGCGKPGNGFLFRAACAQIFPGPVNVPEEAMYWTTSADSAGHTLSGKHDYTMHFAAGQLPPNNAFWSLTMADDRQRFVPNPINRYVVNDRSGLLPNADGSVDIYIQNAAPAGHQSNWLPAPASNFILWLRVYEPGPAILNRQYRAPPVAEVK